MYWWLRTQMLVHTFRISTLVTFVKFKPYWAEHCLNSSRHTVKGLICNWIGSGVPWVAWSGDCVTVCNLKLLPLYSDFTVQTYRCYASLCLNCPGTWYYRLNTVAVSMKLEVKFSINVQSTVPNKANQFVNSLLLEIMRKPSHHLAVFSLSISTCMVYLTNHCGNSQAIDAIDVDRVRFKLWKLANWYWCLYTCNNLTLLHPLTLPLMTQTSLDPLHILTTSPSVLWQTSPGRKMGLSCSPPSVSLSHRPGVCWPWTQWWRETEGVTLVWPLRSPTVD